MMPATAPRSANRRLHGCLAPASELGNVVAAAVRVDDLTAVVSVKNWGIVRVTAVARGSTADRKVKSEVGAVRTKHILLPLVPMPVA